MRRGVQHSTLMSCLRFGRRSSTSADLLENFSPLMLHDEARAVLDRFDEPPMRELVKDMCLDRGLREDVFVRGPRRLSPLERDDALGEVTLALGCPLEQFIWEQEVPVGKATIERGFFGPIVAALAEGRSGSSISSLFPICRAATILANSSACWSAALGPTRRAGATGASVERTGSASVRQARQLNERHGARDIR
jgi:hypothetical protein